ncbi:uncharacterized protein LOC112492546 [Ziziphus jujuba]|uniref:Uncharacterized protein LOC112492546 n=1 Tax=Ziziphus jujuba TaxID=326968 RepID=A0ABM3I817_ZIZJJ|nr:uncharacterized protein LOC112492546 [Ziziphus jujuba]XP_048322804.2 uncharacterized protein LOC112492546 [Ziziphus jujuba]XP_060669601.1 uncharacterized protein LOC112492546 [Ziziphus jujuba]
MQLVESLRRKVMKKFSKREQKPKDWLTDLPPSVQAKVNKFQREGRHIQVIHTGNSEFEVLHESVTVLVDFNKATYDCGVWQLYGIPCKHAIACITHLGVSPIPYVSSCLSKEAYMLTYIGKIHPIPNESFWPQMEGDKVHPSANKRKSGRPKLARRRESDEPASHKRSYVLKCGVCKAMGHNKRTCPKVPLHAKKKKKNQRVLLEVKEAS